jgi:hypothetical protein
VRLFRVRQKHRGALEAHARSSDVRIAKYAPGSNVDLGSPVEI